MLGCHGMMIAALSEYGIILSIKFKNDGNMKVGRRYKKEENGSSKDAKEKGNTKQHITKVMDCGIKETLTRTQNEFISKEDEAGENLEVKENISNPRRLDCISLILFPVAFLIFIVVYWFSFRNSSAVMIYQ